VLWRFQAVDSHPDHVIEAGDGFAIALEPAAVAVAGFGKVLRIGQDGQERQLPFARVAVEARWGLALILRFPRDGDSRGGVGRPIRVE
jgi:hypothetical protein